MKIRATNRHRPSLECLEGRALMAAPNYGYGLDLGSPTNYAESQGVAVDAAGDAVATGDFDGTINLDPNNPSNPAGTLTFPSGFYDSTGTWNGTIAAYVARYDPNGNLLWARGFGGGGSASPSNAWGRKVAVDGSGNIYAVGQFSGTINVGPDASGKPVTLTGLPFGSDTSEYLVKYSSEGIVQWAVMSSDHSGGAEHLAVDPQGDVFIANRLDVNGQTIGNQTLSWSNGQGYLAKYGPNGAFDWVDQFNVTDLRGVAADGSGNAYLTGGFSGTVDFDPGPGTYNLFSGGSSKHPNQAAFVEKLNASGGLAWADVFQATSTGRFSGSWSDGSAIALDSSGDVLTVGSYGGTVDFDPSSKTTYNLPTSGGLYVSKLSPTGQFVWAKQVETGASIQATGIALDLSGNVDLTGYFSGTANFNPAGSYNLTSVGSSHDIVVEQLNSAGGFNWAISAGGTGDDLAYGIAVDSYGDIFLTGVFNGTVNFDPNGGQNLTAQSSNGDAYLWKLKPTP
jgi:hypothetical protein